MNKEQNTSYVESAAYAIITAFWFAITMGSIDAIEASQGIQASALDYIITGMFLAVPALAIAALTKLTSIAITEVFDKLETWQATKAPAPFAKALEKRQAIAAKQEAIAAREQLASLGITIKDADTNKKETRLITPMIDSFIFGNCTCSRQKIRHLITYAA